jgi:hypothetical protein
VKDFSEFFKKLQNEDFAEKTREKLRESMAKSEVEPSEQSAYVFMMLELLRHYHEWIAAP